MNFSDRFISFVRKNALVSVNDKQLPKDKLLYPGDILSVLLPDEHDGNEAQDYPLNILYEDIDLIIAEKPPFTAIHPTKSHQDGTFLNYMAAEFKKRNLKSKVRIITRLDYNTSGIVLVAKNAFAQNMLQPDSHKISVLKRYTALLIGDAPDEKVIDVSLGREENELRRKPLPNGKKAVTRLKKLKSFGRYSLVELTLETGRTHQIRAHMAYIGFPVAGDHLYGGDVEGLARQALHCSYAELLSPRTMEKISVQSQLPEDISAFIKTLY